MQRSRIVKMRLNTNSISLFFLVSVFSLALLSETGSETWVWEAANALGFVSFVGLLVLSVNGRGSRGHSIAHRWLGIAVLASCIAHIIWFLVGDTVLIEYLKPGTPPHMALGIVAFILVCLLSLSALKVFRSHAYIDGNNFRVRHRYLSISAVVFSALHIVLSGYYLNNTVQIIGLVVLIVLAHNIKLPPKSEPRRALTLLPIASLLLVVIFVYLRGFVL